MLVLFIAEFSCLHRQEGTDVALSPSKGYSLLHENSDKCLTKALSKTALWVRYRVVWGLMMGSSIVSITR